MHATDRRRPRGPVAGGRSVWVSLGLGLCLLLGAARAAASPTLTAEVDRDHLTLGETVRLRVAFRAEGMGFSPEMDFDLGDDFEVLSSSTGRNIEIRNGHTAITTQLLYLLRPVRVGRLTLPALSVAHGGKRIATRPIEITVAQAAPGGSGPPAGGGGPATAGQPAPPLFLELALSKEAPVVGEPVVATLYLYTSISLIDLDFATPPDFPDCWVEELESPKSLRLQQVEVGGQSYGRALLQSRLITPNRPGDLTLPAASVVVRHRTSLRRNNDPFSMLPGSMLPGRAATKTVVSPPVTLRVAPLPPEGRPASFTGAVGRFTAQARLDPATARVGEPVKWVAMVRGTGNFRAMKLSLPPLPDGLEIFDTDRDCQLTPTAGGDAGLCTFTTLVVPRSAGDYTLPSLIPTWFDPAAGRYQTVELPAFLLHATAAVPGGGGAVAVGRRSVTLLRQEIHYLAEDAALRVPAAPPWVKRPPFWAAVATPPMLLVAWGIVAIVRRRAGRLRPEAARRAAVRDALNGLRGATDVATVRTLVESALAAIVGRPVGGLRRDELAAAVAAAGQPDSAVAAVAALLDGCDAAAFAPGGGDVARLATEARTAVAGLTCGGHGGGRGTAAALLLVALAAVVAIAAADLAGRIATARAAYEAGDYDTALSHYEAFIAQGESGARHYNAGCAAYQAGELGRAIYHWERARYLDPTLADATANLEVARLAAADQVKPEEVPRLTWLATHENLLASGVVVAWWGLALVVVVALRQPPGGRDGLILAAVTLALAVAATGLLLALAHHQRAAFPLAICLADEAVAHSGPGETFPELFTLHAGAPATLLTRQGGWLRVRLGERLVGWLPATAVGEVAAATVE